jgi:hypothetical protein
MSVSSLPFSSSTVRLLSRKPPGFVLLFSLPLIFACYRLYPPLRKLQGYSPNKSTSSRYTQIKADHPLLMNHRSVQWQSLHLKRPTAHRSTLILRAGPGVQAAFVPRISSASPALHRHLPVKEYILGRELPP